MILISIDDHIIEPPDMFDNHLPAIQSRCTAAGPQPRRQRYLAVPRDGHPERRPERGRGAAKEEYGLEPQGLDEIRPGCYDAAERVKDMTPAAYWRR